MAKGLFFGQNNDHSVLTYLVANGPINEQNLDYSYIFLTVRKQHKIMLNFFLE